AFADYGARLWPVWSKHIPLAAVTAVVALSGVNALGIAAGKITQNLLTATKLIGIGAIVLAGFALTVVKPSVPRSFASPVSPSGSIALALVFVLYAFGGWAHAAFVAAEVRDQKRNLPRALIFGLAGITLIYLIVNATYIYVLDFDFARRTTTPAADVVDRVFGPWGTNAVSKLVM